MPARAQPADPHELLVTRRDDLDDLCRHLASAGRFAFDTEFIRERSYEPRVCLVQVATDERMALLDPLALEDMTPFWELVCDRGFEKVVHAGRQDLELCHLAMQRPPANVFDVQVAAALVGPSFQMSYGKLVDGLLGVQLEQGETFSDWSRRPLSASQLSYAVEDVHYLLPLRDRLGRMLEKRGRGAWLREELRNYENPDTWRREVEEPWLKVRGRGGLNRRNLAVLRELALWRESAARRRDVPARTYMRDEILIEMSRRHPAEVDDLRGMRAFPRGEAERWGNDIIAAVERGLAVPEEDLPERPETPDEKPGARALADLAAAVGQAVCSARDLAPEVFATRSDYQELADVVARGRLGEVLDSAGATPVAAAAEGEPAITTGRTEGRNPQADRDARRGRGAGGRPGRGVRGGPVSEGPRDKGAASDPGVEGTASRSIVEASLPKVLRGWRRDFAGRLLAEVMAGQAWVRIGGPPHRPELLIEPRPGAVPATAAFEPPPTPESAGPRASASSRPTGVPVSSVQDVADPAVATPPARKPDRRPESAPAHPSGPSQPKGPATVGDPRAASTDALATALPEGKSAAAAPDSAPAADAGDFGAGVFDGQPDDRATPDRAPEPLAGPDPGVTRPKPARGGSRAKSARKGGPK